MAMTPIGEELKAVAIFQIAGNGVYYLHRFDTLAKIFYYAVFSRYPIQLADIKRNRIFCIVVARFFVNAFLPFAVYARNVVIAGCLVANRKIVYLVFAKYAVIVYERKTVRFRLVGISQFIVIINFATHFICQ